MTDPRADPPAAEVSPTVPTRVLIADDDAPSRRLLALALEAAGYAVETAVDGKEAVEKTMASEPEIILLDFEMPGLNGVEVCASLRHHVQASLREIPIIMLTAHDGEAAEVACLHAGANDFIAKPIARVTLLARIETQLRLQALNAVLRAQNVELARWREAQVADLEAAQRVQRAILPGTDLPAGWRMATHYAPLIQVGGDIYGVEMRSTGAVVWLADATGHGVAAALCTTLVTILFQRAALATGDPLEVLARVNAGLFAIFHGSAMLTAICAHVAADGEIRAAGAGHPPLLVRRREGQIKEIGSQSTLIGLRETFAGKVTQLRVRAEERVLLFTDGLFSARDASGERQRLAEVSASFSHCPDLEALVGRMLGAGTFDDDVAAILLVRTGV